MKFSIASWNSSEAFGDKERQRAALEHIKPRVAEGVSVVAINEVCRENGVRPEDVMGSLADFAAQAGYRFYSAKYRDKRPRVNQPGVRQYMAALVNSDIDQDTVVERMGTRNFLLTTARYRNVVVRGSWVHLDDRDKETRLVQAGVLLGNPNSRQDSDIKIIAGDLNDLYRGSRQARVLRAAGHFAGLTGVIPEGPRPDQGGISGKLQRLDSILMRANQMAEGTTLQRFAEAGFVDADPAYQATHRLGQLDHCLYRYDNIQADPPVFYLGEAGPSDHRLVQATFEW